MNILPPDLEIVHVIVDHFLGIALSADLPLVQPDNLICE